MRFKGKFYSARFEDSNVFFCGGYATLAIVRLDPKTGGVAVMKLLKDVAKTEILDLQWASSRLLLACPNMKELLSIKFPKLQAHKPHVKHLVAKPAMIFLGPKIERFRLEGRFGSRQRRRIGCA